MRSIYLSSLSAVAVAVWSPDALANDWRPVGAPEYAETEESPEIAMAKKMREAESLLKSEALKALATAQARECEKEQGSIACHAAAEEFSARLQDNLVRAQALLSEVVSEGMSSEASKKDMNKRRAELARAIARLEKEKAQAKSRQAWDAVRRIAGGRAGKVTSETKILAAVEGAIGRYKQLLDGLGGGSLETMRARARALLLHVDVVLMRVNAVREINYLSVLEEFLGQATQGDFTLPSADPVMPIDDMRDVPIDDALPTAEVVYGDT